MPLPIPKLDDKTFEQLVEEAGKLVPIHAPEWTDHNLSDPGITLIELFAWLTEMQLYSLDRVSDRHYLKYLKLIGIKPYPAAPAEVYLTFTGSGDIGKGQKIVAEDPQTGEKTVFETDEPLEALPLTLAQLIVYSGYKPQDVTDFNKPNKNFFYAFGERAESGSALYMGLDFVEGGNYLPCLKPLSIFIKLYEEDLVPEGRHGDEAEEAVPSVNVQWSYFDGNEWVELQNMMDNPAKRFYKSGIVKVRLPGNMNKFNPKIGGSRESFWIRCKVEADDASAEFYEIPPRIERLLLNTVPATQGETVTEEQLKDILKEPARSSGLPGQVFETEHKPVIYDSQTLSVDGDTWLVADDFDASLPEDKHYRIDYEKGRITFGNGINGTVPRQGAAIKISYRHGGGEKGNIRELTINETPVKGVSKATNHFPATGGNEAEKLEDAIVRARRELQAPYTAVTLKDFEKIAISTPGLRVARAKAIALKYKNKVKVVVVPYSPMKMPMPSKGFKATICRHLDGHRLITTDIEVISPEYVRVSVSAAVKIKEGFNPELVRARCIEDLNKFLSPILRSGGENEWPFGRAVYKSEVYEILEDTVGVDGVMRLALSASGEGFIKYEEGNIVIGETALVYPGAHSIEITAQAECMDI